jgi:hypothetical protein
VRTLLICHDDSPIDREGLPRWLTSFSAYTGAVVIRENGDRKWTRIKREIRRVGLLRFADVLAFRAWYAVRRQRIDRAWEAAALARLQESYPAPPERHELLVSSPNSDEARRFIAMAQPDIVIARCKTLLRESIFSIPKFGTYALHPGICPEYRNAHGCFWAMARRDWDNVGLTVLRIDPGVDTGPVFGHFRLRPQPSDSHIVVQHRALLDHLDRVQETFRCIVNGTAEPIDTNKRPSATWGQPWLTAQLRMKWLA